MTLTATALLQHDQCLHRATCPWCSQAGLTSAHAVCLIDDCLCKHQQLATTVTEFGDHPVLQKPRLHVQLSGSWQEWAWELTCVKACELQPVAVGRFCMSLRPAAVAALDDGAGAAVEALGRTSAITLPLASVLAARSTSFSVNCTGRVDEHEHVADQHM